MTRILSLLALAALAGCTPVAYVPTSTPAAPRAAGVWASGGLNGLSAQATGALAVAPVPGVALVAQGVYGNSAVLSEGERGAYVQRGLDLGAVAAVPISARAAVEVGGSVGRDWLSSQSGSFDVGCCSQTYRPVELRTDRVGGHAGLWLAGSGTVEAGPVVRVVHVASRSQSAAHAEAVEGVFVEPGVRARVQRGAAELTVHVGVSVPASDAYRERYSHVPFVGAVGVAYQLGAW